MTSVAGPEALACSSRSVSDDSKVLAINVNQWPGLPHVSPVDIAAQFVDHYCNHGRTAFNLEIKSGEFCSPALHELLLLAGQNMAAVQRIAEYVAQMPNPKPKKFTSDSAKAAHKVVMDHLMSRNSVVTWPKKTAGLMDLFDAAVIGSVKESIAVRLSGLGFASWKETADKRFTVDVNGFYWHTLCRLTENWIPGNPFDCTPEDFERLHVEWVRARACAYSRLLKMKTIRGGDLIPGWKTEANVTLPDAKSFPATVQSNDKLEAYAKAQGQLTFTPRGTAEPQPLNPPLFLLNGNTAAFADGIVVFDDALVLLQSKLHQNRVHFKEDKTSTTFTKKELLHEYHKSGFVARKGHEEPGCEPTEGFSNQRALFEHLARGPGKKTKATVFVFVTQKAIANGAVDGLPDDLVVIHKDNFHVLGPFRDSACCLRSDKRRPANERKRSHNKQEDGDSDGPL